MSSPDIKKDGGLSGGQPSGVVAQFNTLGREEWVRRVKASPEFAEFNRKINAERPARVASMREIVEEGVPADAQIFRRGSEFYREIGQKGGIAIREKRGLEFFREIGKKGGETLRERVAGTDYYSEIGRKGGMARHQK